MSELIKRPSVYELTQEAGDLLARGSDGFDTDDALAGWQDELTAWMERAVDKSVACRAVIERAEMEEDWLKAQAKMLTDRAKKFATLRERVKSLQIQLVLANEEVTGSAKMQTADGSSVSVVRTRQVAVNVVDLDEIPTRFCRVKTEADLPAIKAAYKAGEAVPGVECAETESLSLRYGK